MIITEIRTVKVISDRGDMDCEINHPTYGWIPYTITMDDTDNTIDNAALINLIETSGVEVESYVEPTPPTQQELADIESSRVRNYRNSLLKIRVDPIVSNPLRWAELSAEQQEAWASYRRSLLDITNQEGFPHNVVWPSAPE